MNRDQTIAVMAALNRAGHLRIVEGQVAIWHEALADLEGEAVADAVRAIIRERTSTERHVVPGDIRAAVRPRARALTAGHGSVEGRRPSHPGDQLSW